VGTEPPKGRESDSGLGVAQLVEGVIRRRMAGERVDDEAIVQAHPGLMPELGERLRALRVAEEAERRSKTAMYAGDSSSVNRTAFRSAAERLPPASFPGYKIVGGIHRGGQGIVYRATQTATGREVAIKVMREGPFVGPRDKHRFEREVQILASLRHPHIVTIHDSGVSAGHFYFVMDYIQGEPLDAFISAGELSLVERLELFARMCDAVNAAHLRGVIHRDLKPSNILIDGDGEPHILDFGLAKLADHDNRPSRQMTVTGQFVGSLPWASPEQVDGIPGHIDLRTDVYSLGVILYQMLTSRFPYDVTGNMRDVMNTITTADPLRPSSLRRGINNEVETIVLKCLSKERERRYQSAGELARDVRRYLAGEPIEAKGDSTWYVLRKTVRRYKILSAVVLLAIGLSILMSVMYSRANREAEQNRRLVACLQELFAASAEAVGGQLTVRGLLDQNAKRVVEELADQPALQARFMAEVANKYSQIGADADAARWQRKALALQRDVLAGDARTLAAHHRRLSSFLETAGDYEEAETHYQSALAQLHRMTDGPDPELVTLWRAGAALMHTKGDNAAAKDLAVRALEMSRALHPGDHPDVRGALNTISWVLHDMAEFEAAEAHLREAMAMAQRLNPTDRLPPGSHELGLLYKDMGRYSAAEPLLLAAHEEALQYADGLSKSLANSHLSLAKLYADMGDPVKAEAHARKTLDLHLKIYAEEHRYVARPKTLLGRIFVAQDRWAEAEPLLREAIAIREKRLPPRSWKTAKTRSILGAALAGLGRFEEAEPLVLSGYGVITRDRGPQHRRTHEALQRIIFLYEAWGKPDKADEYRAKLPEPYWLEE
jgi:tetratricopeptide (TPR) repeat protein/predicted Ser/Thr protein kinase